MFEVFFMNEKIDNTLNIALNLPEEDRVSNINCRR